MHGGGKPDNAFPTGSEKGGNGLIGKGMIQGANTKRSHLELKVQEKSSECIMIVGMENRGGFWNVIFKSNRLRYVIVGFNLSWGKRKVQVQKLNGVDVNLAMLTSMKSRGLNLRGRENKWGEGCDSPQGVEETTELLKRGTVLTVGEGSDGGVRHSFGPLFRHNIRVVGTETSGLRTASRGTKGQAGGDWGGKLGEYIE